MAHILLVEDEVLIARELAKRIMELEHHDVKLARSYEEAIQQLDLHAFDIAILDIQLYGEKSGVDVASYINKNQAIPVIYLTSQFNQPLLQEAKETMPVGYLTKPFQLETLRTTLEIALFNHKSLEPGSLLIVAEGKKEHHFNLKEVLYLSVDHVYTNIHCKKETHLIRSNLNDVMSQLPSQLFLRIHRSYAINIEYSKYINSRFVGLSDQRLPIGRTYREDVISALSKK
jgi:DNA-binding LytR/AlgR family response regulator